jgi:hypothetical protein
MQAISWMTLGQSLDLPVPSFLFYAFFLEIYWEPSLSYVPVLGAR